MQYTIQDFIISCLMGKTIYTEIKQHGFTKITSYEENVVSYIKKQNFFHFMGKPAESVPSLWKSRLFPQTLEFFKSVYMYPGMGARMSVLWCTHTHTQTHTHTHTPLDLFGVSTCISGSNKPKVGDTVRDILKSLRPVAPIWVQGDICPGA